MIQRGLLRSVGSILSYCLMRNIHMRNKMMDNLINFKKVNILKSRPPLLDMGCGTFMFGNSHYGDSMEDNLSNTTFGKLCIYVC